jgi:hypothetical protein
MDFLISKMEKQQTAKNDYVKSVFLQRVGTVQYILWCRIKNIISARNGKFFDSTVCGGHFLNPHKNYCKSRPPLMGSEMSMRKVGAVTRRDKNLAGKMPEEGMS